MPTLPNNGTLRPTTPLYSSLLKLHSMKHEKEKSVYVLPRIEATDVAVERGFEGSWAGESDNEEYDIEKEIWG